jgi:O-antigen/teichoic acid export membrane protein
MFCGNIRSFWALVDQGIVSAGNFISMLLLARSLSRAEFGTFVLIYGACSVVNGLHSNLIISPLVVFSSTSSVEIARLYSMASIRLTLGFVAVSTIVVLSASASLHLTICGVIALGSVVAWQIQETLRRSLLARCRYIDAICGDSFSYLGQAVLIEVMFWFHILTPARVFVAMGATSLLAAIIQLAQVGRVRCSRQQTKNIARSFWHVSKWLLLAGLTSIFAAPLFPWLLNWLHGRGTAAEFQALNTVLGVVNPLILSIPAIVMPAAANLMRGTPPGMDREVRRQAMRYVLLFELVILPWLLVVSLWPGTALRWFYGSGSPYCASVWPLRIGVVVYALTVPFTVFGAALVGAGRSKAAALYSACGSGFALVIAPALIFGAGVAGAMVADGFSRGLKTIMAYIMLPRTSKRIAQIQIVDAG